MSITSAVPMPGSGSTLSKVFGPEAKGLLQSVLKVVSREDAIAVLQEEIEKDAVSRSAMALARLRGVMAQPEIEAASGPAMSTAIAAEHLKRSSENVRNLIEKGLLVGYRPAADKTKLLLPQWQFASRGEVFAWVPELIKAYGSNGIALLSFVTAPRSDLDGNHYLNLLLNGQEEVVLKAAHRSNPD